MDGPRTSYRRHGESRAAPCFASRFFTFAANPLRTGIVDAASAEDFGRGYLCKTILGSGFMIFDLLGAHRCGRRTNAAKSALIGIPEGKPAAIRASNALPAVWDCTLPRSSTP